jgi:hypothetical protein
VNHILNTTAPNLIEAGMRAELSAIVQSDATAKVLNSPPNMEI